MRKFLTLTAIAAALLTACKEKVQQRQEIITTDYEEFTPGEPIEMAISEKSSTVKWLQRDYTINTVRTPDREQPPVSDEDGQQYVANAILVSVMRADSSTFFSRTFHSSDFSGNLPRAYRSDALLTSITFTEATDKGLCFMACLNHAGGADDELVPIEMTLDPDGLVTMRRVEGDDMRGNWDYSVDEN